MKGILNQWNKECLCWYYFTLYW